MAPRTKKAMLYIHATLDDFLLAGGEIMKRSPHKSEDVFDRRWKAFFGVGPPVVTDVWSRLHINLDEPELNGAEPPHLLWALMFLKQYGTEETMSTYAKAAAAVDEQTYRKWSKIFIRRISHLKDQVVSVACCC